jgi:hypothetical protein
MEVRDRTVGQSEVIGVILILSITFTGISIILLSGNPTLEDTKDLARTSTAENGLSLLDERVSSAALSGAEKKKFSLNLQSGELSVSPDDGKIRIYSAPPVNVWSTSPSASDATHVLNFTVEAGSDIAGNETDPGELRSITVRYPAGFDVGSADADDGFEGIDTDIDGSLEKSLSVDTNTGTTEFTVEFDGGTSINESDMISLEYGGIDQTGVGSGEYSVEVIVENKDGETVERQSTVQIGDDAEPPVRQIDTTVTMGKIEYETTDSVVAYQNGGVWRKPKDEDSVSKTISKPEVYYNGNTLTASIINITNTADIALGGTPSMTATNTNNERVFPVRGTERRNPIGDRNVYVEVNTSYHQAWSEYFERETVGDVVDVEGSGDTRTVRVELSPLPDTVFNQAVVARNGNLTITNTTVDSYDSVASDYSETFRFGNADVAAGGNVSLENETGTTAYLSRVYGDVISADRVVMQNRTMVNGSVKAYGYPGPPEGQNITVQGTGCRIEGELVAPGTIGATCTNKDNEPETGALPALITDRDSQVLVDDEIQQRIDEYSNSPTYLPDGDGKAVVNVTPGNYYMNDTSDAKKLEWDSDPDKIRFVTDGGPINIAMENGTGTRLLFDDVAVKVDGTNPVRVYSGNASSTQPKIRFENASMETDGDRTDLFTIFVQSSRAFFDDTKVTMTDGTEFYGTIYAPDTNEVQVSNSEIHGAMVVGEADIINSGIHYDQQLRDPAAEGTTAVNYLHVTDNRVRVR